MVKSKSVLINEREDRSVYSVVGKQYEQWTLDLDRKNIIHHVCRNTNNIIHAVQQVVGHIEGRNCGQN